MDVSSYRHLWIMEIQNGHSPPYLRDMIPTTASEITHYGLRSVNEFTTFPQDLTCTTIIFSLR